MDGAGCPLRVHLLIWLLMSERTRLEVGLPFTAGGGAVSDFQEYLQFAIDMIQTGQAEAESSWAPGSASFRSAARSSGSERTADF